MRTEEQMTTITARRLKELHQELAQKWMIPPSVVARSTFDVGLKLMFDAGYSEEQIFEMVRDLGATLVRARQDRGIL